MFVWICWVALFFPANPAPKQSEYLSRARHYLSLSCFLHHERACKSPRTPSPVDIREFWASSLSMPILWSAWWPSAAQAGVSIDQRRDSGLKSGYSFPPFISQPPPGAGPCMCHHTPVVRRHSQWFLLFRWMEMRMVVDRHEPGIKYPSIYHQDLNSWDQGLPTWNRSGGIVWMLSKEQ